ncbi:MAG: hypothetical protein H6621_00845 [Halobacteriovoraceae bacterium]|nr:hypothetical protein [Halobacteriovoraceae bacterium]MCB9093588.1 hypothetical protein [Halobacteriovoraceae bacterium]
MTNPRYSYFCQSCRSKIEKAEDSYIIDDQRPVPFCSEQCIVDFYQKEIKHFEKQEKKMRESLLIDENEIDLNDDEVSKLVEACLIDPAEVWSDKDQLGSQYYYLFRQDNENRMTIVITKYFGDKPSFVFHHCLTKNQELIQYYRVGKNLSDSDYDPKEEDIKKEELVLPRTVIEQIEQMRSEFVAEMVSMRSERDINVEKFALYEKFLEPTLSDPDEVFEHRDTENRCINVSIKAFSQNAESFFYFVICLKVDSKDTGIKDDEVLVPIISFPSGDHKTYEHYQRGSCTTKKSLN